MSKYLWLYGKACLVLLIVSVVWGFICPALVSSDSSFLLTIGIVLFLAVFPLLAVFGFHVYENLNHLLKKEKKNEKASPNSTPRPRNPSGVR